MYATSCNGRDRLPYLTEGSIVVADDALLVEPLLLEAEDEGLTGATEPVLLHLEETLAEGLRVLLVIDIEVGVGIHRVLDLLFAGELTALGDLADDDGHAERFLAPVGDHLRGANLAHRVGEAVLVLAVVQRLERIDDDEDLLTRVLLAQLVAVLEDVRDECVLAGDEAVLHLKALGHLANLEERLLAGVEEADVTGCGDGIRELEAERRLTGAGGTGEEEGRGRRHALTTHGVVEELDAGANRALELGGDLEVEDVGAVLPGLEADVHLHLRHGVLLGGWLPNQPIDQLYQDSSELCTVAMQIQKCL